MYEGFGVVTENFKWRVDAGAMLLDMLANSAASEIYRQFQEFYSENCQEAENEAEAFEWFADAYENDMYYWGGIDGLVTDVMNEQAFGYDVFRNEDFCIYVDPDIPVDASAAASMTTQEDIQRVLDEWLNPLLAERAVADWHKIHL